MKKLMILCLCLTACSDQSAYFPEEPKKQYLRETEAERAKRLNDQAVDAAIQNSIHQSITLPMHN